MKQVLKRVFELSEVSFDIAGFGPPSGYRSIGAACRKATNPTKDKTRQLRQRETYMIASIMPEKMIETGLHVPN